MYSQNDNSFKLTIDTNETTLEHPLAMGSRIKVSTDVLAKRFFESTAIDSGLLPPVVRWISSDFKRFIVERPPFEASIRVKIGCASNDEAEWRSYKIPIPWTVYCIRLDPKSNSLVELYVFSRPEQIFTEADELFSLPVPNTYGHGEVCVGHSMDSDKMTGWSTEQTLNHVINNFWSSEFNIDLSDFLDPSHCPPLYSHGQDDYYDADFEYPEEVARDWVDAFFNTWSSMSIEQVLDLPWHPNSSVGTWIKSYTNVNNDQNIHVASSSKNPLLDFFQKIVMQAVNNAT